MIGPVQLLRFNAQSFAPPDEEIALYHAGGVSFELFENVTDLAKKANAAKALCTVSAKITSSMLEQLPDLVVVSRFGNGTDNVDVDAATAMGIVVTNVPDFCVLEVADHTMALLLAAARKLLPMNQAMRAGNWNARTTDRVRRVSGKRLGLVGFGRISQAVAARAKAFGLEVIACDPAIDEGVCRRVGVQSSTLKNLLETSHFVSLHAPLNDATRHMINAAALDSMRPDSILINTGRGALIDEQALVIALKEVRIAGAALDVYEGLNVFGPPPEDLDHPLFHLPNVVLTPHSAACSDESLLELMTEGASNALAVLQGRWPRSCVNPQVLPRIPLRHELQAGTAAQ